MTALNEFLKEFHEALMTENYEKIAKLIAIDHVEKTEVNNSKRKQSVTLRMKLVSELLSIKNLENVLDSNSFDFGENEEIWKLLILSHLKVLQSLNSNETDLKRYFNAANEQINVINNFLRIFVNSSQLPLLYTIGGDSWRLAAVSGSSEAQEQAARAINRLFIACITERTVLTAQSRKWGTYRIAALLLRVYFHLGQLNLVQNVLKALQACELPKIDEFPRAHTVTFNYFLGRYHFGREEFEASEKCFTFCFEKLQKQTRQSNFKKHLNVVLHFLIPIKLILHSAKPSKELIALFESNQNRLFYTNLVELVSSGNLDAFKELIRVNYNQLIKAGSYGLYEKVMLLVLRQRIIRIYRLTENSTRISLILLSNLCDKESSIEDVTCLVANLIARGLIRGYISEEKQFLVLSAQNPFPSGLFSVLCD